MVRSTIDAEALANVYNVAGMGCTIHTEERANLDLNRILFSDLDNALDLGLCAEEARELLLRSNDYLAVTQSEFCGGFPLQFTLFRFTTVDINSYCVRRIWVITGNLPAWKHDAAVLPNAESAALAYLEHLERWLSEPAGEPLHHRNSWNVVERTAKNLQSAGKKIEFIRSLVIPHLSAYPNPEEIIRPHDRYTDEMSIAQDVNAEEHCKNLLNLERKRAVAYLRKLNKDEGQYPLTWVAGVLGLYMFWRVDHRDDQTQAPVVVTSEVSFAYFDNVDTLDQVLTSHLASVRNWANRGSSTPIYSPFFDGWLEHEAGTARLFLARLSYYEKIVRPRVRGL